MATTLPQRPNLNPSPKTRFQQSADNISKHREFVATREFERASDYALLEYQAQLATECSANPQLSGIVGLKLTGAHEFLQTMKLISERPLPVTQPTNQNLDHKA